MGIRVFEVSWIFLWNSSSRMKLSVYYVSEFVTNKKHNVIEIFCEHCMWGMTFDASFFCGRTIDGLFSQVNSTRLDRQTRQVSKSASTLCHTAKCNKIRLCHAANAKNSVDIDAMRLWHGFCMPRHVAECHVAWKFDRQNVVLIKGLRHRYLPSTVVRCSFWCGVRCILVFLVSQFL